MKSLQGLGRSLFISTIIHLLIFNMLAPFERDSEGFYKSYQNKSRPIKVTSIKKSKKYKTIGVKNGEKNKPFLEKNAHHEKVGPLDLSKLRPNSIKGPPPKRIETIKVRPTKNDGPFAIKTITNKNTISYISKRQRNIKDSLLRDLAPQSSDAQLLRRTGFNMKLEPPEGVTENELNTMEKIYFSFQKRTFITYLNSFLTTYNQSLLKKPLLKKPLSEEKHNLTGKIVFDKEGNIISIKIIRSSSNDDIHELFEETLKGIRKLPNPPKDFISKSEQFTIYYQLSINNQ